MGLTIGTSTDAWLVRLVSECVLLDRELLVPMAGAVCLLEVTKVQVLLDPTVTLDPSTQLDRPMIPLRKLTRNRYSPTKPGLRDRWRTQRTNWELLDPADKEDISSYFKPQINNIDGLN